jgi:VanZ family protein
LIQVIDSRWFRSACIAGALFMAAVLLFGAERIGEINQVPNWLHKVEHFFYYGIMAVLVAHGVGRRFLWIAIAAAPLVGALDEWHQLYVPGRNSSVYDWMVDAAGTIAAVYGYWRIKKP